MIPTNGKLVSEWEIIRGIMIVIIVVELCSRMVMFGIRPESQLFMAVAVAVAVVSVMLEFSPMMWQKEAALWRQER